ncbi:MAG: HAD family hydrolase [Chloroflexaceae bacterium]|jgi:putative hydrolase of the HAD superfamily|nr:HAD family hydrolase [Chloroflexaceae bacterium]
MFDVIAFDADDTLWHNETLYEQTQERLQRLLAPYLSRPWTGQELYAVEMRNLRYFGYGVKGFTLSMIETAIEVTEGRIPGREIGQIIEFAREMLSSPVELLDGVEEVLETLAPSYRLMLITKGDLFDQETKIARSGLAERFAHVEILSDKTSATYQALLTRQRITPQRFLMVGNSMRSDILPVLALGGQAIHIPYHTTWLHEQVASHEAEGHSYTELADIRQLPPWLAEQHAAEQ